MGVCQSAKSSIKITNEKEEEKERDREKYWIKRHSQTRPIARSRYSQVASKRKRISAQVGLSSSRSSAVILDHNVIISKSEINPERNYIKERKLGEGAFGEVWLVKHKELQSKYAMKIIKKPENKPLDEKAIMNEINILKKLDHPNIVKILDFYSTESKFLIITDYCPLGELFGEILLINHYEEDQAAFIMKQILKAVSYCHNMNIIHRDLKPENILIDSKENNGCLQVKIIDFGTAKVFEKGQNENRLIGSGYYVAPEVIERKYTEKCDVWSCGVIMYILLTGQPPFSGKNEQEILESIRKGVYDTQIPLYSSLSKEAKDLITGLLQTNPLKRISAAEALNHQWFNSEKFKSANAVNGISISRSKELLNNIKSYCNKNVVQSTVMAYLIHHNTNIEQCREAGKLFNEIDKNENGKIEKNELIECLLKYWNIPEETIDKEVEKIFDHIDSDQNGYLEYEEFIRAAVDQNHFMTNNYLSFAFKYFDKDNSGDISLDDIFKKFNQNVKNQQDPQAIKELKKIFEDIDINKDGLISYDEFCKMMKNIITL